MSDPVVAIGADDAAELAEILEFISEWLDHDRLYLSPLLDRFGAYVTTIGGLRDDLRRFHDRLSATPVTTRTEW